MHEITSHHLPQRGDQVEAWITRWRDVWKDSSAEWFAVNDLLDDYGERSDLRIPLAGEVHINDDHTTAQVP